MISAYVLHKHNTRIYFPPSTNEDINMVMKQARLIELILYRNAKSLLEYKNVGTLSKRIAAATAATSSVNILI